ncbi:MAG TPA: hypothetical protein ENN69_05970 [Spirochaetia bacterium]|nr:hypothetical protein [Spirochaetia bacterium]
MKKYVLILLVLCLTGLSAVAQTAAREEPVTSFGVKLAVAYECRPGDLSVWNLRYGLALDFLYQMAPDLYLGAEAGAFFGFHKLSFSDPDFDRVFASFPVHVTFTLCAGGFLFQAAGGVVADGQAVLVDGVLYASDFVFRFYPDFALRIGIGTMTGFYLKAGYTMTETGRFTFGLGLRLGLF